MAPKVGRASVFALRHPWRVVVGSGVAMYTWDALALRLATRDALLISVVVAVVQTVLWFPRFGVARRYTEWLLADEGRAAERHHR